MSGTRRPLVAAHLSQPTWSRQLPKVPSPASESPITPPSSGKRYLLVDETKGENIFSHTNTRPRVCDRAILGHAALQPQHHSSASRARRQASLTAVAQILMTMLHFHQSPLMHSIYHHGDGREGDPAVVCGTAELCADIYVCGVKAVSRVLHRRCESAADCAKCQPSLRTGDVR